MNLPALEPLLELEPLELLEDLPLEELLLLDEPLLEDLPLEELLLVAPELELLELVPLTDLPPEELLLVVPELELLELLELVPLEELLLLVEVLGPVLELAAGVLLRVTVAEVGEPKLAAPATDTRLTLKFLLAPLGLTGTTIVLAVLSPSAHVKVPLVDA